MSTHEMVSIVDDDPSIRKGISNLLRAADYNTQVFAGGREFLEHGCVATGCIIMDLSMPDMTGLEVQQALLEQGIHTPIIFLSGNGSIPNTVKALKDGALDFLEKPVDADVLFKALKDALEIDQLNRKHMHDNAEVKMHLATLTPRELEVLLYVIAGALNKVIAHELKISEKTVKVHRARVMEKMAVHSVAELVRHTESLNVQPAVLQFSEVQ